MKLRALFRWVVIAGLWVGCLSPTLPIPPPDSAVASFPDPAGEVTVTGDPGSANPSATVTVYNPNYVWSNPSTPNGIGTDVPVASNGSWSAQIPANVNDLLYIHQSYNGESSPDIYVLVPPPPPTP